LNSSSFLEAIELPKSPKDGKVVLPVIKTPQNSKKTPNLPTIDTNSFALPSIHKSTLKAQPSQDPIEEVESGLNSPELKKPKVITKLIKKATSELASEEQSETAKTLMDKVLKP
jgi:hypothetical protein